MLIRLFEMSHVDNVRILKALIYSKDDQLPLVEGTTKKKASMEVLKRETVLLFISDLDISHDKIMYLSLLHQDTRTRTGLHYQIVWLPIMDRSTKPLNDAN
ncbi:Protein SIEVE ELEMENT OCCLUSION B [Camellia lanceoleosa]|uniref:Protein SIEVE ELEMENT OCCLUSION B n=1 Tax=Camellia lanceoleosa TaxID=1840588 RepID=A0ACC0GHZ9_9ERIC|nr:Protein SIEVE ELEMENT OCCLUSION B [Camellia lanceoleosa]